MFLSENYRLIVAPRKFDVLKANGKDASFKNIKFPRGNEKTDSSETLTLYCLSVLFTTKFSCVGLLENRIELSSSTAEVNVKFEKENRAKPT